MSTLHSALQALSPVNFADIPTSTDELDPYVADLFSQAQLILESIPIVSPDDAPVRPRSQTTTSVASNVSEMSVSSARSEPPAAEFEALQKEWGKPIKLSQKENPLGISVYKVGGKDSRGAWFARRSVHEGLGFARFKSGLQKEFPTSLAVQGGPGEGNVRGIGADTKVESINVANRGKVEVYRLTAQFPGPTTPRDFVTLLVTSSTAMKQEKEKNKAAALAPRHYMIISKPCNHPDTHPKDGFIRGQYESVEFIREVPRKLKASMSQVDLSQTGHKQSHNLEQHTLIKNAEKKSHGPHHKPEDNNDSSHLAAKSPSSSREPSPGGRKRSVTVDVVQDSTRHDDRGELYDPEQNPVEWIMVTRSDPGGSVPRFMVERGTPASICADAGKFLDWACRQEDPSSGSSSPQADASQKDQLPNGETQRTENVRNKAENSQKGLDTPSQSSTTVSPVMTPGSEIDTASSGLMASVAGTLSAITPNVVLKQFQNNTTPPSTDMPTTASQPEPAKPEANDDNDDASSISSFASADSHIDSPSPPSLASPSQSLSSLPANSPTSPQRSTTTLQHEKELAKLASRKAALDSKYANARAKLAATATKDSDREISALRKAEEKHARDLRKHEDKYKRELEKIEARRTKEAKKFEDRRIKQADKDEKDKLKRERDEMKEELEILKKEKEILVKQVGELQKENTELVARLGRVEIGTGLRSGTATPRGGKDGGSGRDSASVSSG